MLTLKNTKLTVKINPKGAELTHIIDNKTGQDFIWNGEEWAKHAPILFPAIGRSTEDEYLLDGKLYPMQQHGFATDYDFELLEQRTDFIKLLLKDNLETYQSFPFHFEFIIIYRLEDNVLNVAFEVKNLTEKSMAFALGFHPAFNLPGKFEDYQIRFATNDKVLKTFDIVKNPFPYRSGKLTTFAQSVSEFFLERRMFADGLVIFDNKINQVKLSSVLTDYAVSLEMSDFPYLCLWTKEDMTLPYLCIEPFSGLPDVINQKQELLEKEGNHVLTANEAATYKVKLTFDN